MHYQWTVNMTGKYLPPYTNSPPKESPHLQLTILAFCLIFRPYLKFYCLQSAYESASWLCQSGVILCVDNVWVDNVWVHSISQCLGRPGLTNIKLHWYDLNHQLHLQVNTLVNHHWRPWKKLAFYINWKSRLFALALFTYISHLDWFC